MKDYGVKKQKLKEDFNLNFDNTLDNFKFNSGRRTGDFDLNCSVGLEIQFDKLLVNYVRDDVMLFSSGNVNVPLEDGSVVRAGVSPNTGEVNTYNFNVDTDTSYAPELGDQGDPAPSQDLSTNDDSNNASNNYGGGWDDGYWSEGGYIPASQSITQGMSMGNVTKFTQKDRYGNMLSVEFDVPKQMEIPHPGHPMGTDTVPAWLTPGERVMNAEAERMYGPILKSMNDQGRALQAAQGGTIPEYAACGSKVKHKSEGGVVYAQEGVPVTQGDGFIPFDQMPGFSLIKEQEGFSQDAYPDVIRGADAMTVGYGHRLLPEEKNKKFTPQELEEIYLRDFLSAQQAARENIPEFDSMSPEMQGAFTSQAFQLGKKGQADFENMIAAIEAGDKGTAIKEVFNSDWAKQTPERAEYLANAIQNGSLQQAKQAVVREQLDDSVAETGRMIPVGYLNTDLFDNDGKFGDLRIPPNPASGPIKEPTILDQISDFLGRANRESGIGQIQQRNKELAEQNRQKRAMKGDPLLTAASEDIGIIPDIIDADDEIVSLTEIPNPQPIPPRERAQVQRDSVREREGEGWTSDMAEGLENREKAQEQRLAKKGDDVESNATSQAGRQEDIVGGRSDKATKTDVVTQETTKENAVKGLESTTDPSDTPSESPDKVEKGAKNATPEQKQEAKSFFDEWGLSELFNKKEIGKMMALYLGSRALGYSHNGSLNFAAKNYVTGIERISKVADKLAVEGKHTKDSIKAYRKSGDMTDLILKPVKPKRISAEPLTYYIEGADYEKARVKLYEWEDQATKSKYLGDAAGNPIDMSKVHNEEFRVPNSPEYRKRYKDSADLVRASFKELDTSLNRGGKADGDPILGFGPEQAVQEAAKWAVLNEVPVDEVALLSAQAYRDAIAEKQRNPKVEIRDIRPYLNQQIIKTFTDNPNLLKFENDEGEFVPVDASKLSQVNKQIAQRIKVGDGKVGVQWKNARVRDLANQYISAKELEWYKLQKEDKAKFDKYNNRANEGENGFLLFMLDDFGLLDKGRMK